MRITFAIIALLYLTSINGQSYDYLKNAEGEEIKAEILKLDGKKIAFKIAGEDKVRKENFYNYTEMQLNDLGVIENPLNLSVERPESGFAYIYIYRPYVYIGAGIGLKVKHNGQKLANIKTYSYYLHKVPAGSKNIYQKKGYPDKVTIDAEDGQIYFIRVSYGSGAQSFGGLASGVSIFLDNPKMAKYAILTMKKKSQPWN